MQKTKSASQAPVRPVPAVLAGLLISGCTPSIAVFGSYFPDWLFCIIGGLVLMLIVRAVLVHLRHERACGPPVLAFSCLTAIFSLLLWLVFF